MSIVKCFVFFFNANIKIDKYKDSVRWMGGRERERKGESGRKGGSKAVLIFFRCCYL